MVSTDLSNARLTGSRIYGISAWDVKLDDNTELRRDLIITPDNQSPVIVDDLEVAQFVYLLLNNAKIRNVIDTITSRVVLLLGNFSIRHKVVLDNMKDELRKYGFVPVLFDFDGPTNKDTTGTVETLARMARFVIADLSEPKSVPHELASIIPHLRTTPIMPLQLKGSDGYSMFKSFSSYPWVLNVYHYEDPQDLISSFEIKVIEPVEKKFEELQNSIPSETRVIEPTDDKVNNLQEHTAYTGEIHASKKDQQVDKKHHMPGIGAQLASGQVVIIPLLKGEKFNMLRAIDVDPYDAYSLTSYASFLANKQYDLDEAEKYYQNAIRADQNNAYCLANYAVFLENKRKNFDKAEKYYQLMIHADTDYGLGLFWYGSFLGSKRNDVVSAKDFIGQAAIAEPESSDFYWAVYWQCFENNLVEAEKYYRNSLKVDDSNANSLGNLAGILFVNGKDEEAAELLQESQEKSRKSSDDVQILENLFYHYAHGDIASHKETLDEILLLLRKGVHADWPFGPNVERAREVGHPDIELLELLDQAINGKIGVENVMAHMHATSDSNG